MKQGEPPVRQTWQHVSRRQFKISLWKNCLLKARNRRTTCCELFTPLLAILILVFSWAVAAANMSVLEAKIYTTEPIPFFQEALASIPTLFGGAVAPNVTAGAGGILSGGAAAGLGGVGVGGALLDIAGYTGPFPIPTFDGFVNLHYIIKGFIENSTTGELLATVEQYTEGRLGALPYLGSIAFCPDTPEVRALVKDLTETTTTFADVFDKIYPNEQAALDNALKTTSVFDRTWAIVRFDEINMAAGRVDYSLRLNDTIVPNTRFLNRRFFVGLDTNYQKYFFSGFLTLQSTIDSYFLRKIANFTVVAPAQPFSALLATELFEEQFPGINGGIDLNQLIESLGIGTIPNVTFGEFDPDDGFEGVFGAILINRNALLDTPVDTALIVTALEQLEEFQQNISQLNTNATNVNVSLFNFDFATILNNEAITNLTNAFNTTDLRGILNAERANGFNLTLADVLGAGALANITTAFGTVDLVQLQRNLADAAALGNATQTFNFAFGDGGIFANILTGNLTFNLSALAGNAFENASSLRDIFAILNISTDNLAEEINVIDVLDVLGVDAANIIEQLDNLTTFIETGGLDQGLADFDFSQQGLPGLPSFADLGLLAGIPGLGAAIGAEEILNLFFGLLQTNEAGFVAVPMPTPPLSVNPFYAFIGPLGGMIFTLSMLFPVSRLLKLLVEEKETRMAETMKIMGLQGWVSTLSWFVTYFGLFAFIALIQTAFLSATLLSKSSFSLVFVLFSLHNTANICFAFFVSCFFSKAKLAAILGPLLLFATQLPRYTYFTVENSQDVAGKTAAMLLSSTAFAFGCDLIMDYEGANVGMKWENLYDDQFSMANVLLFLFLDCFIYAFLAAYFARVFPNEYGIQEHPLFCFQKRYWKARMKSWGYGSEEGRRGSIITEETHNPNIEPVSEDIKGDKMVEIKNLRKVFSQTVFGARCERVKTENVAVDDLNLDIYKGQITSLLGHNGAGKTTAISMLTGLIPPTSGDCIIGGNSIRTDMAAVRDVLGVCPQHNVLFDSLTCEEHLRLFATYKGVPEKQMNAKIQKMLSDVGLGNKAKTLSSALSGGMKRKLSVGIALIGDPKVVFLDEPTSGMDPYSRRATWDVIKNHKAGRAIVLTTHFMDEADILGDRVVIMADGQLKCAGTSLFLKRRYGVGYSLTMVKDAATCDVKNVTAMVKRHVPTGHLKGEDGGEMTFELPFDAVSQFEGLFRELETSRAKMGIGGYGISMATLEDVFINISSHELKLQNKMEVGTGKGGATEDQLLEKNSVSTTDDEATTDEHNSRSSHKSSKHSTNTNGEEKEHSVNSENDFDVRVNLKQASLSKKGQDAMIVDVPRAKSSHYVHLRELIRKRFRISTRDFNGRFCEIFFPVVMVTLSLLVLEYAYVPDAPPIKMDFALYNNEAKSMGFAEGTQANVFYSGTEASLSEFERDSWEDLENQGATATPHTYENSEVLSEYLLFMRNKHADIRMGAFVTNDTIQSVYNQTPFTLDPTVITELALGLAAGAFAAFNFDDPEVLEEFINGLGINIDLTNVSLDFANPTGINLADFLAGNFPTLTTNATQFTIGGNTFNVNAQTINVSDVINQIANAVTANNNTFGNVTLPDIGAGGGNNNNAGAVDGSNATTPVDADKFILSLPTGLTCLHNATFRHGLPILLNGLTESRINAYLKTGGSYYRTTNHPLPITAQRSVQITTFITLFASIFTLVPFCFLPGVYCIFLVKERISKAKHLQLVSGVSPAIYWLSNYIWDIISYTVVVLTILVIFAAYDSALVGDADSGMATFMLFMLYGMAVIPLCYCFQFSYTNSSSAMVGIASLNMLLGFILVLLSFVLDFEEDTEPVNKALKPFYRLSPAFCLGEGLVNLASVPFLNLFGGNKSPWDWDVAGRHLVYLFFESIGYFLLTLYIEYGMQEFVLRKTGGDKVIAKVSDFKDRYICFFMTQRAARKRSLEKAKENEESKRQLEMEMQRMGVAAKQVQTTMGEEEQEDEDVRMEREKIASGGCHDMVVINGMSKIYPARGLSTNPVKAVDQLYLSVPESQCFGFLGINGAGKTTTMQVLTGDHDMTSGSATIRGYNVATQMQNVRQEIGYCPQFDPLMDLLTVREHLELYGWLRGITEKKDRELVILGLMERLGLLPYENRVSVALSGGNKRKLSLGLALIGRPKVVFLDEPSTGMDPVARRFMWEVISKVAKEVSVVLTTHSMEECEALCGRIGIMVNGRLTCLGSVQHLKSKFGGGYQMEINCDRTAAKAVSNFVEQTFSESVLDEAHDGSFKYRLPAGLEGQSLSAIFAAVEKAKNSGIGIIDYSISQCSLEQIFILMAKKQHHDPRAAAE